VIATELNDLVGISKLAITMKAGAEELDSESQMYMQSYINRSPAGSDSGRIREIEARLEMIQIDFEYNLGDDGSCIWLTEAELKGVPRVKDLRLVRSLLQRRRGYPNMKISRMILVSCRQSKQ
jgi:hypothetical protein